MVHRFVFAAILSVSLASSGVAAAAEWVPRAMGNRIAGEVDWYPYFWNHVVAMGVAAQVRLDQRVFLDLDFAWVIIAPGPEANEYVDTKFAFGNPTVGVHWADLLSDKLAMHVGGTVTVPTLVNGCDSVDPYCDDNTSTPFPGTYTRAYADLHRFLPDYIFLRARTGVDLRIFPELYYRAELVSMIAIPLARQIDAVEYIVDIHNEMEARASFGMGGGLHLQAVFNTKQNDNVQYNDTAQLAVEPFVSYDPGRGFYARVGCLVALDDPLGFGLDRGGMASIRVTLGGRW